MKCNIERLVNALVSAEMAKQRKLEKKAHSLGKQPPLAITFSRGYGSCGTHVARTLAERLDLCLFDKEILEQVAAKAEMDVDLVEKLEENTKRFKLEPWRAFFTGKALTADRFQKILQSIILNVAAGGCIILGRGANLVLGPKRAFRVRIVGSLDNCAQRIAKAKGIDLEAAKKRVIEVNRTRDEFLKRLYGTDISDATFYDITLNSDQFDVDHMVDLVMSGMEKRGMLKREEK